VLWLLFPGTELAVIGEQYPFEPLKYLPQTLRLRFEEGIRMLQEAGVDVDPFGDLSTAQERALGQLVREKYDTDFYILHRYPLAVSASFPQVCACLPDMEKHSTLLAF
jgi:aspartyl-tRNA synthetase